MSGITARSLSNAIRRFVSKIVGGGGVHVTRRGARVVISKPFMRKAPTVNRTTRIWWPLKGGSIGTTANNNVYSLEPLNGSDLVSVMGRVNTLQESARIKYGGIASTFQSTSHSIVFDRLLGIAQINTTESDGHDIYLVESRANANLYKFTPSSSGGLSTGLDIIRSFGPVSDPGGIDFNSATGANSTGRLWVVDQGAGGGNVFVWNSKDSTGASDFSLGSIFAVDSTAQGEFAQPWDVSVDQSSTAPPFNAYVTDIKNNRVQKFSSSSFALEWGGAGAGNGQFDTPLGIKYFDNEVYVADFGNSRIQVFNTTGGYLRQWGTSGTSEGALTQPVGVEVLDELGNTRVYVTDRSNDRVTKFDSTGGFVDSLGFTGTGRAQFSRPLDLVIDSTADRLYVTDWDNNNVQWFDAISTTGYEVTEWNSYTCGTTAVNIGIHPALGSLNDTDVVQEVLVQVRDEVEELSVGIREGATGGPFNWQTSTSGLTDTGHLYTNAVDVSNYGQPSSCGDNWATSNPASLTGRATLDIDIGELSDCVTKLEAGTPL